jgi:hypothetical protein
MAGAVDLLEFCKSLPKTIVSRRIMLLNYGSNQTEYPIKQKAIKLSSVNIPVVRSNLYELSRMKN